MTALARLRAAVRACETVADPVVEMHATDSVWAEIRADASRDTRAPGLARVLGLVVFAVRRNPCLVTRSGAKHPLPAGKPRPL